MSLEAANLLLLTPNWLGDAVMALPAIQSWTARHPASAVTVLSKPGLVPFWRLCPGLRAVETLAPGTAGTWMAGRRLRPAGFDAALLLPHSLRAGLIPWLAAVPRRRGTPGHGRRLLLTDVVNLRDCRDRHQAYETFRLFGLDPPDPLPAPRLAVPHDARRDAEALLGAHPGDRFVGVLPGAARGASKRWPQEHFIAAGRDLQAAAPGLRFAICGTAGEAAVCQAVAAGLGPCAVNLAGRTSLVTLAAVLARCAAICCNDSGGMHLAASVGTPVVAVFGLTDPSKTGPLGGRHRIISLPGSRHDRAIPRQSAEAEAVLAAIPPAAVAAALAEVLAA